MHTRSSLFLLVLAGSMLGAARAQTSRVVIPSAGKVVSYQTVVGPLANARGVRVLAAERLIRFPRASFLQIGFSKIQLGEDSSLEVISLLDDERQTWTRNDLLAGASLESAYFNGEAVLIRLWAGPKSRGNAFVIRDVAVGNPADQAGILTICGSDNRTRSSDPRVARIMLKFGTRVGWCTAWLISPVNCFATAGHCLSGATLVTAEFNVPLSSSTGALNHPSVQNQYTWEGTANRSYENAGRGRDWGVFTTQRNQITKRWPGSVQRSYFTFQTIPARNTTLTVTGHGTDSSPKSYNGVQQTNSGPLVVTGTSYLGYRVDTMGGNSGSPVYVSSTGRAVAVHTHGGCTSTGGYNSGTRYDYAPFASARTRHCTRPARPDFKPTFVSASSSILRAMRTYTLYGRVYNYGTATATGTAVHGFYVSTNAIISTLDLLIGTFTSTNLPVGSSTYYFRSYTMPRALPSGSCWLGLYADKNRTITEDDETNNTIAKAVTCFGLPDLTVTSVATSATTLYPNLQFRVTSTIKNVGSATAGSSIGGHYLSTNSYISTADTLLLSFSTASITPGASQTYSHLVKAPASLPNATCWVGTYADRTFLLTEVSETNNGLGRAVTCRSTRPLPDLKISVFSASTTTWRAGQTISTTTTVQNAGSADAGAFTTGIYHSADATITTADRIITSFYVTSLAKGASTTRTASGVIPKTIRYGVSYVGAYADRANTVAESNEANNWLALQGKCLYRPDLKVQALAAPTTAAAGAYFTFTMTTANIGYSAADRSMTGLYLSTNAVITHADTLLFEHNVGLLNALSSSSITRSAYIPRCVLAGGAYLGAWADHALQVTEANESNNVLTRSLQISAFSGSGRYVEFLPSYASAAVSTKWARVSAARGGKARMCVTAVQAKGAWYLLLWSGRSSGFQLDALTNFQLALLNTPVFANWFGRTSTTTGRAYPNFMVPAGLRLSGSFRAYTYSFWFSPGLKKLLGFGNNSIWTDITP